MTSSIQTDTSIDYAAFHEPVTEADVTAYKTYIGKPGFTNLRRTEIFSGLFWAVFLGLWFMPLLQAASGNGLAPTMIAVMWGCAIAGAIYLAHRGIAKYIKDRARLYKFAVRNKGAFIQKKHNPAYAGMIFDEGHSREIDSAFIFPGRAELGNYTYVTGGGKNRSTHHWAYIKVKLPRKLPHMVLDAKKNNIFGKFSNLTDTFDQSQTLSLEGDFNEHFTLYAPKQYERDALYVFTPDVMARLIDNGSAYDMEVIDDELFIYKSGKINLASETELRSLLAIVDAIGTDLRDQTDYYADERVGDRTQNIIAAPGARLKQSVNWVVVGFVILMILFYTFDLWGRLLFWR